MKNVFIVNKTHSFCLHIVSDCFQCANKLVQQVQHSNLAFDISRQYAHTENAIHELHMITNTHDNKYFLRVLNNVQLCSFVI